jgi:L-2-hydroxycarboxylate dehydrogenase (NAD+)
LNVTGVRSASGDGQPRSALAGEAGRVVTVAIEDVDATCVYALEQVGVPEPHARQQVALLLDAELRGHSSHGLLRLPRLVHRIRNGVASATATGDHVWAGNILHVEGGNGLGPVVAMKALDLAIARARESGVAVAAIRNCNHLGMLAWYAESVAARGQVVVGLTLSEALVHPWGGRQAMLGTNPITIGVPAMPAPFVLDMATSIVSMGKIHAHADRGEPLPEGWALDANGDPTTDARAAKAGSIAPFGGVKGYALGLAFEVLIASMTGSAIGRDVTGTLDADTVCNKGDLFIVMEPAAGAAGLITEFMNELRGSPADRPDQPVRIPGDRSQIAVDARQRGTIALLPSLWSEIGALAAGHQTIGDI